MNDNITTKELLSRGLPKWPSFMVVGEPVTLEQAEEILIRTANFHFSTNDRYFKSELYKELGISMEDDLSYWPKWEDLQAAEKKYGTVPQLEYLTNSRICSAYVGGPHGWCDWEGNIGCNSYNIGKWPSVTEVYNEWVRIAAAFPFLKLKSQLFDGETSVDEETHPVVQFDIEYGNVEIREPENLGVKPYSDLASAVMNIFVPGGERGCTISKFRHALQTTLKRVQNPSLDLGEFI